MKDIVLCDIDGTVAACEWRTPYKQQGWDAYHAAAEHDEHNEDVVNLLHVLARDYCVVGLTSRPEKFRQMTVRWLVAHGVPMHAVLMRPNDCYLPSPQSKLAVVRERFGEEWYKRVLFMIDDRQDVVIAFVEAGLTGFLIYPGRRLYVQKPTTDP